MKYHLILILLFANPFSIHKVNSLKTEAKNSFQDGDYQKAISTYRLLIDSLAIQEDELQLNLAHSYFHANDTANALAVYHTLTESSNKSLRSKACHQIGVVRNRQGRPQEALEYFKMAIKADPENTDARYNYELLKKYISYPETILRHIKFLVKQRKYTQARNFLSKKMKDSRRIQEFKDYGGRIENIIKIDSLEQI